VLASWLHPRSGVSAVVDGKGHHLGPIVTGEDVARKLASRRVPMELSILYVRLEQFHPRWKQVKIVDVRKNRTVVIVGCVHMRGRRHLLDVAQSSSRLCRFLGLGKYGEQNGGENRDNRDDDEKLDERKGSFHNGYLGSMISYLGCPRVKNPRGVSLS